MRNILITIVFIFTQIIFLLVFIPYSFIETLVSWRRFGDFSPKKGNVAEHEKRMRKVQKQVIKWRREGLPKNIKMCSGRKVWQTIALTPASKSKFCQIDIAELKEIVEIDAERRTITLEPGMMMGRLTGILEKLGWTIPVVPELDTLTVGGLIAGGGIETSSHKYGPFHDTILEMEILLPTGEIVTCSKDVDPDLFYATPGAYGTLGFILSATFPLLQAGRFVKLEYRLLKSFQEALNLIENEVPNYDFIEGLAYSEELVVVMLGNMVDQAPYNEINHINKWNKPFFYKHVEKVGREGKGNFVEYIPLRQYYHRHTRTYFWLLTAMFPVVSWKYFPTLFGWTTCRDPFLFRRVPFLTTIHQKLQSLFSIVIQDYVLPIKHTGKLHQLCAEKLGIYPVWICPSITTTDKTVFSWGKDISQIFIDLGYYGYPTSSKFNNKTLSELVDDCIECEGGQGMYGHDFVTREQILKMVDDSSYQKIYRERGFSEAFPMVLDKVCRN